MKVKNNPSRFFFIKSKWKSLRISCSFCLWRSQATTRGSLRKSEKKHEVIYSMKDSKISSRMKPQRTLPVVFENFTGPLEDVSEISKEALNISMKISKNPWRMSVNISSGRLSCLQYESLTERLRMSLKVFKRPQDFYRSLKEPLLAVFGGLKRTSRGC